MKNENYIQIQGWMINELNLKGNELLLYAIIYGFSQDGKSEYHGSISYIEDAIRASRPNIIKILKKLLDKKLIIKTKESHYIASKQSLPLGNLLVNKVYQPSKQSLPVASKQSLPNNNNTNNNTNNICEQSSQFSFSEELLKMKTDKRPLNVIIAYYWEYKGSDIVSPETKEQFQSALRKELRSAEQLKPYPIERIKNTMFALNSSGLIWSLKAVSNWIDKDLKELNKFNK